uniref:Uncharacterized protein n=1 Tax=Emiliania huxleyi (strain CCMP1516) TaxID=280463 RepID=A0A0D3JUJ1_EMIH1
MARPAAEERGARIRRAGCFARRPVARRPDPRAADAVLFGATDRVCRPAGRVALDAAPGARRDSPPRLEARKAAEGAPLGPRPHRRDAHQVGGRRRQPADVCGLPDPRRDVVGARAARQRRRHRGLVRVRAAAAADAAEAQRRPVALTPRRRLQGPAGGRAVEGRRREGSTHPHAQRGQQWGFGGS